MKGRHVSNWGYNCFGEHLTFFPQIYALFCQILSWQTFTHFSKSPQNKLQQFTVIFIIKNFLQFGRKNLYILYGHYTNPSWAFLAGLLILTASSRAPNFYFRHYLWEVLSPCQMIYDIFARWYMKHSFKCQQRFSSQSQLFDYLFDNWPVSLSATFRFDISYLFHKCQWSRWLFHF